MVWEDSGFKRLAPVDEDGDGKVGLRERLKACVDKDGDGNASLLEARNRPAARARLWIDAIVGLAPASLVHRRHR